MAAQSADRQARTEVPIHPPLAHRWSPRAFDSDAEISDEQLVAMLEAARWAPTWGKRQPVRFIVGRRGDETFDALAGLLARGNAWALRASALILLCTDVGEDDSADNANVARYAVLDAGSAMTNLTTEAVARGLITHPMAGFRAEDAPAVFALPAQVLPLVIVAVGVLGDPADAEIVERDTAPRTRRDLDEVAFAGRYGLPWRG